MKWGKFLISALLPGVMCAGIAAPARAADKARITGLSDISFGSITSFSDQTASQNLCAYTSSNTRNYSVTATGSGTGGAFALSSGAAQLPYEVQWADAASQTAGVALVAGSVTSGFTSLATQQFCNSGPSASASLIVVIRSATLAAAMAGSYSGTLEITIAPQ